MYDSSNTITAQGGLPQVSNCYIRPYNPYDGLPQTRPWVTPSITTMTTYTPPVLEYFKTDGETTVLRLPMLGFTRDNITLRVTDMKTLHLEAKDGGLDGLESKSKTFTIPSNAHLSDHSVTLENGILEVRFNLVPSVEIRLEVN